jgi:hypothetical protein
MKADRMGVIVNHRFDRLVLRAFGQIFKPKYPPEAVITAFNQRKASALNWVPSHPSAGCDHGQFRLSQTLEETMLKRSVTKGFW